MKTNKTNMNELHKNEDAVNYKIDTVKVILNDASKQVTTVKCETEESAGLPEKGISLEDVLTDLKLSGRYHIRFMLLMSFILIITTGSPTNYIFTAEKVNFRCKYSNCKYSELARLDNNATLDLKCYKYELLDENRTCTEDNFNVSNVKDCSEWEYENPNSFVAEFNLGCEDWKRTLVGTIHSVGFMIGLLLLGPISDKFGRKNTIIFTSIITGVLGIVKSTVTSYWLFIALEMLEPMLGDSHSTVHTISVEMVTTKDRPATIFIASIAITVADIIMAFTAYLSPNWRIFLVLLYAPSFFTILYIFWLDESLRWLLIKGKRAETERIIRKAAKLNNVAIDVSKLNNLKIEEASDSSLGAALRITFSSRKLCIRFMLCICIWFTGLFNAYTLLINSVALEGNKYINYGLVTLSGAAAGVIILFLLSKFNRKGPFVLSLTLTGVFCVAQSFVPQGHRWLSTLLYVCGKLNAAITIKLAYLYTTELFPTYTRNTMLALCSSLGRVGAILAPLTPLLFKYWSGLPSFLVGVLSLLTASIVTLMPDTSEDVLPDNVKQAEAIGSKEKKRKLSI